MLPSGQCPRWHISWINDRRHHIFGSLDRISYVTDPTVSGDRTVVDDATSAGHRIGSSVPLLRVTGSCLCISTSTEYESTCQALATYRPSPRVDVEHSTRCTRARVDADTIARGFKRQGASACVRVGCVCSGCVVHTYGLAPLRHPPRCPLANSPHLVRMHAPWAARRLVFQP